MSHTVSDPVVADTVRQQVDRRLCDLEAREKIHLLLCVESGSRAWGFPSPDSDYDVRFLYVRPRDWYLDLAPGRDVVETPITDLIDLNGWDIRKALLLLLGSNATVSEWLASPVRYRPDDPMVPGISTLADRVFNPRGLAWHYANLGSHSSRKWLSGIDDVPVKQYFYALRPALAVRALRLTPTRRPPMDLSALMEVCDLPQTLVHDIDTLVEAKRCTHERGNARRMSTLDVFIQQELARAGELPERRPTPEDREQATALFRDLVNR